MFCTHEVYLHFFHMQCKVNDAHEQEAIKNFHQNEKKVIFYILYKNE